MLEDAIFMAAVDKPVDQVLKKSVLLTEADADGGVLFVTTEFERHTGYTLTDVFGRNLRMLQGPDTSQDAKDLFRYLIRNRKPGLVDIVNYRKDGRPFLHCVDIRPVRNKWGVVTHFLAIQHPKTLSCVPIDIRTRKPAP